MNSTYQSSSLLVNGICNRTNDYFQSLNHYYQQHLLNNTSNTRANHHTNTPSSANSLMSLPLLKANGSIVPSSLPSYKTHFMQLSLGISHLLDSLQTDLHPQRLNSTTDRDAVISGLTQRMAHCADMLRQLALTRASYDRGQGDNSPSGRQASILLRLLQARLTDLSTELRNIIQSQTDASNTLMERQNTSSTQGILSHASVYDSRQRILSSASTASNTASTQGISSNTNTQGISSGPYDSTASNLYDNTASNASTLQHAYNSRDISTLMASKNDGVFSKQSIAPYHDYTMTNSSLNEHAQSTAMTMMMRHRGPNQSASAASAATAAAMANIEETLSQLGSMFSRMAWMVAQQGESLQRIDSNTEDLEANVSDAHKQLLAYQQGLSKNGWMILRMFIILIVFLFVWAWWRK